MPFMIILGNMKVEKNNLLLTKKDVEALLNGMTNPKEPNKALKEAMLKFIRDKTDVIKCKCKIPEPHIKNSENGISSYCGKCAKGL